MKLIHLSDFHLGKKLNEFSLIEDQEYILNQILQFIDEEKPDGVIIAGDIYDRFVPTEEAMKLWDTFLINLSNRGTAVYAISGNHDSAVRFSDHRKLIENTGIHFSGVYDGSVISYELNDVYGRINIYLLPFIKPAHVRAAFPDEEIRNYTDAIRTALSKVSLDKDIRNVLVSHQFVTGAQTCDSEEIAVGGLDNVDAQVFEDFDYVALGHIHGRQTIGRETVCYSGTPLKYSFSEKNHIKSLTVVELKEKGKIEISTRELKPLHDVREIRGTFEELMSKKFYEGTATDDYLHAVLTDEDDVIDAMARLRTVYTNLMTVTYDNERTRYNGTIEEAKGVETKSALELFEDFFTEMNNVSMSEEQKKLSVELIEAIQGGE